MPFNEKESVAQPKNLEQLIKANTLRIFVGIDNYEELLEIKLRDCGFSSRAVIHSLNTDRCVVRVFLNIPSSLSGCGVSEHIFDVPILTSSKGEIKLGDIKQIPLKEYSKQKSEAWIEEC